MFALLKELLAGQKPAHIAGLPPFTSGAVGFFAYDVVRRIERLPETAVDDLGVPDACLMFFDEVLAFDHVRKQISLIVTADLNRQKPAAAYADARKRLGRLEKRLARPLPKPEKRLRAGKLEVTSHTRKRDFLASVAKIKEYIAAGDIFQAVLSQRFEVKPGVDPFSIYRSLRTVNPSPYLYFLRFGLEDQWARLAGLPAKKARPTCLVGSSPELLVRVQQRNVEYRPIAGTRPRSANEAEDLRIEQELLANEKEAGRARDAGRSGAERYWQGLRVWNGQGEESDVRGAIFPRDASGQRAGGSVEEGPFGGGCILFVLPGRDAEWCTEDSGDGDY